jgi:hypothetical protein
MDSNKQPIDEKDNGALDKERKYFAMRVSAKEKQLIRALRNQELQEGMPSVIQGKEKAHMKRAMWEMFLREEKSQKKPLKLQLTPLIHARKGQETEMIVIETIKGISQINPNQLEELIGKLLALQKVLKEENK